MAYKNLKTKEKTSCGDSQKWSCSLAEALKSRIKYNYLKRGLTMLVLRGGGGLVVYDSGRKAIVDCVKIAMFSLLTVYVICFFGRILILTFIALGELEEPAAVESASCFTNLTKKLSFVPLEKELYVCCMILSHSVLNLLL